jgi:hypothetical protein
MHALSDTAARHIKMDENKRKGVTSWVKQKEIKT